MPDLRAGFVVMGLVAAQACGGQSVRRGEGGEDVFLDGGTSGAGNGASSGASTGGTLPGAGGAQTESRTGGSGGGSGSASGGATSPATDGGTNWSAGSSPFGGFSGIGGFGGAMATGGTISIAGPGAGGGTGALGAAGDAFAGAAGGASIVDSCNRYCRGYAARCATDTDLRTCISDCSALAGDLPQCAPQILDQVDCLLSEVNPNANCSGDCSVNGTCPSVTGTCVLEDINICSQGCETSKTVEAGTCIYLQRCREGTREAYCSRLDGSTWSCLCFEASGAPAGGEFRVIAPDGDACAIAGCDFVAPF